MVKYVVFDDISSRLIGKPVGDFDTNGLWISRKSLTSPEIMSGDFSLILVMAWFKTDLMDAARSSIASLGSFPTIDFGDIRACQSISSA
ncbi:MAG: hypothetical protein A2Y08_03225 [Planctomycetes bacterium GWA2_40_7]|nr:MAG: hypothetical protein A2Y08_03225 [Planctomycetes bacterium GWA2_40_7]